jgi:hypothetical protein
VHRAPVLRRIRPLRILGAQKVDYYMLRVRIKMRSSAYAASRQDTDYTGAGVGRNSWGRSITRGKARRAPVGREKSFPALIPTYTYMAHSYQPDSPDGSAPWRRPRSAGRGTLGQKILYL